MTRIEGSRLQSFFSRITATPTGSTVSSLETKGGLSTTTMSAVTNGLMQENRQQTSSNPVNMARKFSCASGGRPEGLSIGRLSRRVKQSPPRSTLINSGRWSYISKLHVEPRPKYSTCIIMQDPTSQDRQGLSYRRTAGPFSPTLPTPLILPLPTTTYSVTSNVVFLEET